MSLSHSNADVAIQRVETMSAAGPHKRNSGNWPSACCSSSRNADGCVWMSGSLRPSAGYIGLGVTAMSALEYMLYHQNSLAHVKDGSRRRAASHSFSPPTRRLDWRPNQISERSRKYHTLPTMP